MFSIIVLIASFLVAILGFIHDHTNHGRLRSLGIILIVLATIGFAFGIVKERSDNLDKLKQTKDLEKQTKELEEVKLGLSKKLAEERETRAMIASKLAEILEKLQGAEKEVPPDVASRLRELGEEIRGLIEFKNGSAASGIIEKWITNEDGTEVTLALTPAVKIVDTRELTIDMIKDILDKNKDRISNIKAHR